MKMVRVGYILREDGEEEIGVEVEGKTIPLSEAIQKYTLPGKNLEKVIKQLPILGEIEVYEKNEKNDLTFQGK